MMISLAYLMLFGMIGTVIFKAIKLPGLIGMLIVGIMIGPQGFGLLQPELLAISEDLRKIALIIILLRAGLGLNLSAVKSVGKVAGTMSVIPVMFEGIVILLLAMWLLDFSFIQGGMLGFVIAAVSPAVIVPSMIRLKQQEVGKKKNIPTLILASASIDDVIAITIFSTFLSAAVTQSDLDVFSIFSLPISILLGILLGAFIGFLFVWLFRQFHIRDTKKILLILSISILFVSFTEMIEELIYIASLLGVMTIGLVFVEKRNAVAKRLAIKFDKIWIFAELFLFVLVGAAVDISIALEAGLIGLFLIFMGLTARFLGIYIATFRTTYVLKEKLFMTIAFTPKATVQAAMGSIPLSLGIMHGEIILAISVLAILITAPLGSSLIQLSYKPLLNES